MSSSEGKYQVKKKDPLAAFYPIIGLVIFAIAAAVGWFSAPFVLEFAGDYIPAQALTSLSSLDPNAPLYTVAFFIFLLIIMLFSAIYAVFAPKPGIQVSESSLKRERDSREEDRRRAKLRKRKMRSRMKQANKGLDDI